MKQYRICHKTLHTYCREVFATLGLAEHAAGTVADNLLEAELRGVKSHGVAKIKEYANSLESGRFNKRPDIKIVRESAATLAIDGDFGMGAVTGKWAMEKCLEKAAQTGMAFATVGKGRHFGMAAFYSMMALPRDMIGIALCNSGSIMAVYGGTSRVLGTNPISIAVPASNRYPLVFDAATSQAAFNKIIVANLEGRTIPNGWAVDKDGNATTNAGEALLGSVLPFGGYKGSGLAIMVQVLSGVLSGAFQSVQEDGYGNGRAGVGFFLGAIRIDSFLDTAAFKEQIDKTIDDLKASRRSNDQQAIYMPGELEYIRKEASVTQGVEISEAVYRELIEVREKYRIDAELAKV